MKTILTGNKDDSARSGRRCYLFITVLMFLAVWAGGSGPQATWASTIFVKHDASGNNSGDSWTNAFPFLQDAIDSAVTGDRVWVAGGTYTPGKEVGGTGDSFKTYQMKNGVSIYGGFAGDEDPDTFDIDNRDFEINETILSGDLGGGTHAYHLFRHVDLGLDNTAVLDGFTVAGGKADGSGNDARGGGMLNMGSASANGSSPTIRNCIFKNNEADGDGGAMYNSRWSNPDVSRTAFIDNSAGGSGGAVYNTRNNPSLTHCAFIGNTAGGTGSNSGGGAIYNNAQAALEGPTISHSTFNFNTVSLSNARGGAIFNNINPGTIVISDSTFTANQGQYGAAIYNDAGSTAFADDSAIEVKQCDFYQNAGIYGAGIYNNRHNTRVISCRFRGNDARNGAGTDGDGGAIMNFDGAPLVVNSVIAGNRAGNYGGGIHNNSAAPIIVNTTISGNYAARGAGVGGISGSAPEIKNSIVWGNAADTEGNEFHICSDCGFEVDYSFYGNDTGDVHIASGGSLTGNDNLTGPGHPVFLNPVVPTGANTPNTEGNYFICCSSAAIDAGNNDFVDGNNDFLNGGLVIGVDIRGKGRIFDGNDDGTATVDMGAYEFADDACVGLAPEDGDGSAGTPYQIASLQNLYWIAEDSSRWGYHYAQVADIDAGITDCWFGGAGWQPIGNSNTRFTGSYDGQGYSISNLHIYRPETREVGLFGEIGGQSGNHVVLKNMTLLNASVTAERQVGALVGRALQYNDIINCHVSGSVKGTRNVGGLVGHGIRTNFLQCSSSATVEVVGANALYHGGLIGHIASTSTVRECFATGNVSGRSRVGGLIGAIGWNSFAEDSYARGDVTSTGMSNPMIGGLIGEVWNGGVRRSYSTGVVDTGGLVEDYGGLVGLKVTDSNFFDENNFWDEETSGLTTSEMGTGKTTVEMKDVETFTDTSTEGLDVPWDFVAIWDIDPLKNNGYPHLRWQTFEVTGEVEWTGGGDGESWDDKENWNTDTVPTISDNVTISGSGNNPVIGSAVVAEVNNLTVAEGATLIIQSDGDNTGALIVEGVSTGAVTVQRHLEGERWYIIGPPVIGQNVADLLSGGSNAIALHNEEYYGATDYNEAQNRWNAYYTKDQVDNDLLGAFSSGTGYLLRRDETDGSVSFTGELETGIVEVPLTTSGFRWNCVGNPYSSAIGVTGEASSEQNFLGVNQNILDASHIALYIWDDDSGNYVIVNNANFSNYYGYLETDSIQLGQGFIVRAAAEGNITFTPGMRVGEPLLLLKSPLLKAKQAAPVSRSSKTQWPGVVISATVNNGADAATAGIAFHEGMSLGLDPGYDAGIFRGNPEVAVYTQLAYDNGEDFGLQCLPPSAMGGVTLPVGLEIQRTGVVNLRFDKIRLPQGVSVTLEDRKANTAKTITMSSNTYTTTVNSGEPAYGRFYLSFEMDNGLLDETKDNQGGGGGSGGSSGCFIGELKTGR